ncbi:MAG: DUF5103 domain-containing protein [Balneola sp.]|nr:DUF5103 domain-containing protein [Balneola sp.]MBO6651587.1 DUF5103 domain-containing protein [Balneola sp.]MBO6710940.1 DUF5103 domain-containing protein [Balneola sp.]MBO6799627.1 DUF5103 domain-containing protein [Balneola sp.]MBO6870360.1 DUF5103 domain-containing protein [Balneola sp.]
MYRFSLLFIVICCFSCSGSSDLATRYSDSPGEQDRGLLLVSNQLPTPDSFKSIQLYRKGNSNNPPIINLNNREKLVLEFDELTSISGQFRITFEHFDQNWNPSNIPEAWYLDGFNELVVSGGEKNALSKPNFFHYKTEFPNNVLKFTTSGNYLLNVYDYSSNTKLFSIPFFVTEQVGKITSRVETLFNSGDNFAATDQLFSTYDYPEEVEFPQFDLAFSFVQNRFWGSAKSTSTFDVTTPGKIRFYTPRNNSFSSGFDFIPLDLTDLNINLDKIEDWQPEYTPPRILLKRDILNFSASPNTTFTSNFGKPEKNRDSRYAETTFRFDSGTLNTEFTELYVAGDFNSWILDRESKLNYNSETDLWTNRFLIKQGNYRYKYFQKSIDSVNSEPVPINDSVTNRYQEYRAFVYFLDPAKNYQRLLISGSFNSK